MALHMRTVIARSTLSALPYLWGVPPEIRPFPLLYTMAATQHTPSREIETVHTTLSNIHGGSSVGCLSAPIPTGRAGWEQYMAISAAWFDPKHATLFRSTIPGREALAKHGRYRREPRTLPKDPKFPCQDGEEQEIDWEDMEPRWVDTMELPMELDDLEPDDVHSILYFTDDAPENLNHVLSEKFPSATQLGMVGTSTHFVTGRPSLLFDGREMESSGAVGVCLHGKRKRPTLWSEFPGLEPISRPMSITECKGNLIESIELENPSARILDALKTHPLTSGMDRSTWPDLRLYMGTLRHKLRGFDLIKLSRITSMDLARGPIALHPDDALPQGALVRLFLLPPSAPPSDLVGEFQKHRDAKRPQRLAFASTELNLADLQELSNDLDKYDDVVLLEDAFLVASENGCVINRAGDRPWTCTVPGAMTGFKWPA